MYFRTNLMNLFGDCQDDDFGTAIGISDYDIAILRIKTGHQAIAIRRAAMKIGPDLKKIEAELKKQGCG